MKTHFLNFAAAALIVLAAASCNKEEIINTGGDGTKAIALSISIGEPGTKALISDVPYQSDYDEFEKLDIYFTNTGGKILYHWAATASEENGSNGKILWDNFVNSENGVKFLGLSGDVTGVYVVANVPTLQIGGTDLGDGLIESDANINELNNHMELIEYGPIEEQNKMPYAGGDIILEPISDAVSENAGEIKVGENGESGNYVKAEIYLRPAISRVEIKKVGVKNQGTNYYKYADGSLEQISESEKPATPEDGEEYYSVQWRNFSVKFVGVYMSDVYRQTNLFPASSNIAQWDGEGSNFFNTPVFENGQPPIMEGKWVELSTAETDLNNILAYADYNTTYQDLVTDPDYISEETPNKWLFNGAGGEGSNNPDIIPFHFFVPYNVTDEEVDKVGVADDVDPKLHFQFTKGDNYEDQGDSGFKIEKILKYTNTEPNGVEVSAGNVFDQLKVMYNWPVVISGDGTAYANVIKFVEEDGTGVVIKPGYIYRLQQVLIDPTNLNPAPSNNDVNDIYVVVTVVPFNELNVYPVFE